MLLDGEQRVDATGAQRGDGRVAQAQVFDLRAPMYDLISQLCINFTIVHIDI